MIIGEQRFRKKGCGKKQFCPNLRYCPDICLKGLKKITKTSVRAG
jgi:hypothetical protein